MFDLQFDLELPFGLTFGFSERVRYMLSPIYLSSVTLVHPTEPVEIFANVLRRFVPWPSFDIHGKFYRDRPRETTSSGEINTTG